MKRTDGTFFAVVLAPLSLGGAAFAAGDDGILQAPYAKVGGVEPSGTLSSVGSDTMNNLMTLWAEGFRKVVPGVKVQVEGKGSSTAPPALNEGVAQLGPMSRDMKNEEIDAFEKKYGYKPTRLRVALDALAVFVHKDNPIRGLSLVEADAIFSKTRKQGHPEDIATWGQLGLTGEWAKAPISLFGRNSASGTYGFFKEHALKKGDFKDTVKEQPGSSSVVQGVSEERFAIGYSGIGYRTPNVRALPLSAKPGGKTVEGTLENVLAETYPLGRYLNLYVNRAPGKPLDPAVRELCRFIFSREGQEVVVKDGFLPLPPDVSAKEMKLLE
ncbi:MAG TPA: PstS family phosphate ABC transporter substrate-binding protein [Planctomycetota bacterium]|jgi:phosphate transport system substrate-binding protein|nr:PstS family phosphate ABC transporter substrate-binding protein [Planctomycetota bacterium]